MRSSNRAVMLLVASLAGCSSQPQRQPPAVATGRVAEAPATVDVVDRQFGLVMPDPYRWMEDERNGRFDGWLRAQAAATRERLDALPAIAGWSERLGRVMTASTRHAGHRLVDGRVFFLRLQTGKPALLGVREADGSERVLVDPAKLGEGASIGGFNVSPAGDRVAVHLGFGGNEIGELAFFDSRSGARLADTLKPVWSEFAPAWLPDGSGVFYTRMREVGGDDPDALQGMTTLLHRFGTPPASDRLLAQAGAGDTLAIAARDFPNLTITPGGHWAVLEISGARASRRLCVAPLADTIALQPHWRCVVDDPDQVQDYAQHGDLLYLLSTHGAANGRVLALDLREPAPTPAQARVLVPERADAVLTQVSAAADGLYLKAMQQGLDRIERRAYADGASTHIELPYAGTSRLLRTDGRVAGALLSLEGWTRAASVHRYDGRVLHDIGLGDDGAPDYPDLITEPLFARSADGTRVPLSVVRRRDLRLDGHARALLEGYGGYGVSLQPMFAPSQLEWSQAGNVWAICHVRGGGELGDGWRIAGSGSNKQRGVEDFIACAAELARRGYSVPTRTAGTGASMGGVLVGGAYTSAPTHWGAMVIHAGVLNPVRLLAARNGANQMTELGDPRTEPGLRQLLAMDPYQRVRDGAPYPPLLLVIGMNDQRVAPWNSGKFGARVQQASPATPVWYRGDEDSGHFATSGDASARQWADIYAFLEAMLKPG